MNLCACASTMSACLKTASICAERLDAGLTGASYPNIGFGIYVLVMPA